MQTKLFEREEAQRPTAATRDHQAAFRRIRNYLAGRFVGATRDESLLGELLKCLYTQLYLERNPQELPDGFNPREAAPDELARLYRKTFGRVRNAYAHVLDGEEELLLDPAGLSVVVQELWGLPFMDGQRDVIGDAFQTFIGSHVRGQEGQFFTPSNAISLLVEAVDPSTRDRVIDPACGAGGFLSATLQHLIANGATARQVTSFIAGRLYGVDKDSYLAQLARTHLTLLSSATPHIECADSLAWKPETPNSLDEFPVAGSYDIVLTNPPFGANIVAAAGKILADYQLARKWKRSRADGTYVPTSAFQRNVAPQVLFVERCIQLVKPGGRIGIVLPESLISSSTHRYVVDHIRSTCTIELVAGMPESLFKTSGKGGTHTKTCLVVLERKKRAIATPATHRFFMAEAQWCGHDSRGKEIPHDDLPSIAANYSHHRTGKRVKNDHLGFVVRESDVTDHVLAPRYYDPKVTASLKGLKKTHELVQFGDLVGQGVLEVSTGDEVGKLAYSTGPIPFVRTSDLSNWEIKVDPKHGLSEEIYERFREKQDVRTGDILMVRDGTYLIGTCAMLTEHDRRIVYQSHIYKIRVRENDLGITPHLLLAVLSCAAVQQQVRAKRFTQDIIDSLGNRINELVLPIPKTKSRRDSISAMVEQVISDRVKARELSRKARELVLEG